MPSDSETSGRMFMLLEQHGKLYGALKGLEGAGVEQLERLGGLPMEVVVRALGKGDWVHI